MRRSWLGLLVCAACGDSDTPDAAMLSAADMNDAPISSIEIAQTPIGGSSTTTIHVRNTGAGASAPLAVAFSGPHANDFALDNQLTTCAAMVVAAGATCDIAIVFRPADAGDRTASLTISGGGDATLVLALHGEGFVPDLAFTSSSVDFGQVEALHVATMTVEIHNSGTQAAALGAITVTGTDFARGASSCGTTLDPGASCDVVVSFAPAALGAFTGSLSVASANTTISVPVTGHGARRVTVVRTGSGSGNVASTPTGITCGATCSALFETGVTLTATADAASALTSWSETSCGSAASCAIPAGLDAVTIQVSFALSGTASLQLTFAGDAAGAVRVVRGLSGTKGLTTCFASCTVPVDPGDLVALGVATPSTFGGIAGACTATTTTGACSFTAVAGTNSATATFMKDPKEQWTRLFGGAVLSVAHDTSGNIIVGTATSLVKLSSAGATLWTVMMPTSWVATGPSDTIYVVSGSNLVKLDAAGATLWTRALDANSMTSCARQCIAVGTDGAVAVHGAGVTRWDASGTLSWSKPALSGMNALPGVVIDAQGTVYAGVDVVATGLNVRRIQADGTELSTLHVAAETQGKLAIDSDGYFVASTAGSAKQYFDRTTPAGTNDYGRQATVNYTIRPPNGVAASSGGTIGWFYLSNPPGGTQSVHYDVAAFTNAGTDVWTLQRWNYTANAPMTSAAGSAPNDISYRGNQLVLAGAYKDFGAATGWVQAFTP